MVITLAEVGWGKVLTQKEERSFTQHLMMARHTKVLPAFLRGKRGVHKGPPPFSLFATIAWQREINHLSKGARPCETIKRSAHKEQKKSDWKGPIEAKKEEGDQNGFITLQRCSSCRGEERKMRAPPVFLVDTTPTLAFSPVFYLYICVSCLPFSLPLLLHVYSVERVRANNPVTRRRRRSLQSFITRTFFLHSSFFVFCWLLTSILYSSLVVITCCLF